MRGVGSRPITLTNKYVKATSLGGTVEKLEMGMTGETRVCAKKESAETSPPCPRRRAARFSIRTVGTGTSYVNELVALVREQESTAGVDRSLATGTSLP